MRCLMATSCADGSASRLIIEAGPTQTQQFGLHPQRSISRLPFHQRQAVAPTKLLKVEPRFFFQPVHLGRQVANFEHTDRLLAAHAGGPHPPLGLCLYG